LQPVHLSDGPRTTGILNTGVMLQAGTGGYGRELYPGRPT